MKEGKLNWLSINALASKFAFLFANYPPILLRAWKSKDAFLQSFSICSLNLNLLRINISSNFTALEQGIILLLIFSLKDAILLSPRTISWNFPELPFMELTLNQSNTFLWSYLRFENTWSRLLLQLLSSAQFQTFWLCYKK